MAIREWKVFLTPYEQAVDELKIKFRSIRKEFRRKKNIHLLNLSLEELKR